MIRMMIAMGIVVGFAVAPLDALAERRQEHARFEFGPSWIEFEAGALCDFAYGIEEVGGWVIRNRFFDADGNRIRAILIGETTVRHWNLDTEMMLEETYHHRIERDFVTGEETMTGNFWHLRAEDGTLVLVGSGRQVWDLFTFELIQVTPHTGVDFAATICPALGGAPADP